MKFNLKDAITRATDRTLHDEQWWARQGVPMPPKYQDFAIPDSIRKGDLAQVLTFSLPKGGDSGKQSL